MVTIFLKPEIDNNISYALVKYRDGVSLKHNVNLSTGEDFLKIEVEPSPFSQSFAIELSFCNDKGCSVYRTAI
jgi:hypothetical protein